MSQASSTAETRISVANLARVFGRNELRIGVLNSKAYNERTFRILEAFGGAAFITREGRKHAEEYFGAHGFPEADPETKKVDARFIVPTRMVGTVVEWFRTPRYKACEIDLAPELTSELTKKTFDEFEPILLPDEVAQLRPVYRETVLQPLAYPASDTSSRAQASIPTQRIFHLHDVEGPEEILRKILASPVTYKLEIADLRTTKGGTQRGRTSEGTAVANNLWYY